MEHTFRLRTGIKIWFSGFEVFAVFILLYLIFDKKEFNAEKICAITLIGILLILGLLYTTYLFCYKIKIGDRFFAAKKFFAWHTYRVEDITNIQYKRIAFGDYTYVIRIGKKKVEISQLLRNKVFVDKFFEENGVFRKFPRVAI